MKARAGRRAAYGCRAPPPAVTAAPESQTVADVYLATGNGSFSPSSGQWGQSVLRLHHGISTLGVTGFYTPNKWSTLNTADPNCTSPMNLPPPYTAGSIMCSPGDFDLDSGGVILARPAGTGFLPSGSNFVVLAGGKEGLVYVVDPSNMTNTGADTTDPCSTGTGGQTIQCFGAIQLTLPCCNGQAGVGKRGSAAFWPGNSTNIENVLYVAGSFDTEIRAYQMASSGGGSFSTSTLFGYAPAPNPNSQNSWFYPGSPTVITWNSSGGSPNDAILWVLDTSGQPAQTNKLVKLYAYQAVQTNSNQPFTLLWSDTTNGPLPTHFMVPTVVHGQVFVGGQKPSQACTAGSCTGRVVVWQ
jgi:hypothetical protein